MKKKLKHMPFSPALCVSAVRPVHTHQDGIVPYELGLCPYKSI